MRRSDLYAVLYAFPFTSPIPRFPIPLLPGDPEPELDLNLVLLSLFDWACHDQIIDHGKPPDPELRQADLAWAAADVAGMAEQRREPFQSRAAP